MKNSNLSSLLNLLALLVGLAIVVQLVLNFQEVAQWARRSLPAVQATLGSIASHLSVLIAAVIVLIWVGRWGTRRTATSSMSKTEGSGRIGPGESTFRVTLLQKRLLLLTGCLWFGSTLAFAALSLMAIKPAGTLQDDARDDELTAEDVLLSYHPYLQDVRRPNDHEAHTDHNGFRSDPIERKKSPGTYRIFMLGGSTVWCTVGAFEETHPRLLEGMLRAHAPNRRIEVVNYGTDGHCSQHSVIKYLFKVREFDPDLVIVWHAINDMYHSYVPYAESVPQGPRTRRPDIAEPGGSYLGYGEYRNDYSHFFGSHSRMMYERAGYDPPPPTAIHEIDMPDFPSIDAFSRNMRLLASQTKLDGVRIVFATQPHLYKEQLTPEEIAKIYFPHDMIRSDGAYPSIASLDRGMDRFNEVVREIGREYEAPVIELDAAVPKDLQHFVDDVHYTVHGNHVVARTIADFLIENDLVGGDEP